MEIRNLPEGNIHFLTILHNRSTVSRCSLSFMVFLRVTVCSNQMLRAAQTANLAGCRDYNRFPPAPAAEDGPCKPKPPLHNSLLPLTA